METLASVWTHDLSDLSDPVEEQHEPPSVWEAQCVLNYSSPPGPVWTDQLSPHLQRNKQLQDTLLQREEELVRLQEENNKLREFLNSSFVKSLEEKAKKLTADGSRRLKRSLLQADIGTFQNHGPSRLLLDSQRVSKRVCRNLTAEFCSESEMSAASEPNLDLWVLRTLGLKDRDTIDTSNESSSRTEYTPSSSSSSEYNLSSSYNTTVTSPNHPPVFSCSSSSEYTLNSSFSPSVSTSTPPAINNCDRYCQTSRNQTTYGYSATECREANTNLPSNCSDPAFNNSVQNCKGSPDQCSNFTAIRLTGQYEANDTVINGYHPITAFQSSPLSKRVSKAPFTQSPERPQFCSVTTSSQTQSQEGNTAEHLVYWSPQQWTQSQETIQFTQSPERVQFSPISASTPVTSQHLSSMQHCTPNNHCHSPISSTGGAAATHLPATPQTPRSRTDLAFSMSLSPSSSVKTHSFPQGQAFVRKDTQGRWNFTWVPKQGGP